MADDDALIEKGMPIRREVLGPQYVDASMARADDFMMSFQRATTAWAWGWAWGDPTLDRKTRSLMNLAMLTALNRAPEIARLLNHVDLATDYLTKARAAAPQIWWIHLYFAGGTGSERGSRRGEDGVCTVAQAETGDRLGRPFS